MANLRSFTLDLMPFQEIRRVECNILQRRGHDMAGEYRRTRIPKPKNIQQYSPPSLGELTLRAETCDFLDVGLSIPSGARRFLETFLEADQGYLIKLEASQEAQRAAWVVEKWLLDATGSPSLPFGMRLCLRTSLWMISVVAQHEGVRLAQTSPETPWELQQKLYYCVHSADIGWDTQLDDEIEA
jgi:hypothetical protein